MLSKAKILAHPILIVFLNFDLLQENLSIKKLLTDKNVKPPENDWEVREKDNKTNMLILFIKYYN